MGILIKSAWQVIIVRIQLFSFFWQLVNLPTFCHSPTAKGVTVLFTEVFLMERKVFFHSYAAA